MRTLIVALLLLTVSTLPAQTLDDVAWTLPNLFKKVPPLKNDNAGRFPMISIEIFKLNKDDTSYRDAKPFPPEVIRELKARGLTQWIPPDVRYIPFALSLQKENAGVIMMQGYAFNGPPDLAPTTSMHILPADYKGKERPGQQPVFPCPLVLDGWVIHQEQFRETFRAFKDSGVKIDAVWLDWEIQPDWRDAEWDEAKNCSRCRQQFPAGVLDDQTMYRRFIEQWRVQLFSVYFVAPIFESYPHISVTNWEEIISTPENPTPSWSGNRQWSPKDLGMFTAANPVAYGNTIWKKHNWKEEWGWPVDVEHMDRLYTSVMLNQISVHERNAQLISPWKQSIPWIDRYCADDKDPSIPILSRERYREILRHLWLRGSDGMQVFNPIWFPDDVSKMSIVTEEIEDAVQIYDEMLTFRNFLDTGLPLNTETIAPQSDGAIWSGLRTENLALVRAFTQSKEPVKFKINPFGSGDFELEAPPAGKTYLIDRVKNTVEVK